MENKVITETVTGQSNTQKRKPFGFKRYNNNKPKPKPQEGEQAVTAEKPHVSKTHTNKKPVHQNARRKPHENKRVTPNENAVKQTATEQLDGEKIQQPQQQRQQQHKNPRRHPAGNRGRPQRYGRGGRSNMDDIAFSGISEIGQGGYAKPSWYSPKK